MKFIYVALSSEKYARIRSVLRLICGIVQKSQMYAQQFLESFDFENIGFQKLVRGQEFFALGNRNLSDVQRWRGNRAKKKNVKDDFEKQEEMQRKNVNHLLFLHDCRKYYLEFVTSIVRHRNSSLTLTLVKKAKLLSHFFNNFKEFVDVSERLYGMVSLDARQFSENQKTIGDQKAIGDQKTIGDQKIFRPKFCLDDFFVGYNPGKNYLAEQDLLFSSSVLMDLKQQVFRNDKIPKNLKFFFLNIKGMEKLSEVYSQILLFFFFFLVTYLLNWISII